ncbi:hypothetical protein E4631_24960 [Hymenobacter sp. UV11]|uniref:hypothetical protein n=1 Tax=Hymenobacter sp. UV11 TaxID=1849735 RepID=UPI00105B47D3|nr:hypothetical protein [Hymenobacter sp. UV11]TDN39892.1 hypothetical protein A8B98_16580 [Hymenobacter sp. UV11]TFZ62526.1 hypothetical protein E4631_24960 [Hymenobacter sp. UV11]
MAYHKRPLTTRTCAHCHEAYQAVDRRRLYCSSSCKVSACQRRRRALALAKQTQTDQPQTEQPSTASSLLGTNTSAVTPTFTLPDGTTSATPTAKANPQTLAWNLHNMALLGTAAALGNLGVKAGERVAERLKKPAPSAATPVTTPELVDPLNWLPPGLLTATAPRVPLEVGESGQSVVFVHLRYLGHTLYYQPTQRLLLWRAAPGDLQLVHSAEEVAFVAEQTPCDDFGPNEAAQLGAGWELKTLG